MRSAFILAMLAVTTVHAETGRFSDFCCFIDHPSPGMYYYDGTVCDGPFRANDPMCIWSDTPGRLNDPWFYSLTLASPFYYCSTGGATNPQTVPHCGNLWIEPYELMELGPPWFVLGADRIPFSPDSVNWQEARDAALSGGLYFGAGTLPSGTRLLLSDDTLLVRTSPAADVQEYDLAGLAEPVVWIENGATNRIYLKGYPGDSLGVDLTIGMNGHLYIAGDLQIDGGDPGGGMLGLVTVMGDLVIANDPQNQGGSDWPAPWDIETMTDFTYSASMLACDGVLQAENFQLPQPPADLLIRGSVQTYTEGYTMWGGGGGFSVLYSYDTRLFEQSPPYYPCCLQTGTEEEQGAPMPDPILVTASPDPFSGSVTVTIDGAAGATVLQIFDVSGRLAGEFQSVENTFHLDAAGLPTGLLILRAVSGGAAATARTVHIP